MISKRFSNFLIATLLLQAALACTSREHASAPPAAQNGELDLTQINFTQSEPIELRGEWRFVSGSLLSPAEFDAREGAATLTVPDSWDKTVVNGRPLPLTGVATYRLKLRFDDSAPEELMLRIPAIDSVFRIYANGRKIAENGDPAAGKSAEPGFYAPQQARISTRTGAVDVLVELANYQYPRGGIRNAILLGTETQISAIASEYYAYDLFLLGAILIMGIYHVTLYLLNRDDLAPLAFAALCLLVSVRMAATGEGLLYRIGWVEWRAGTLLEYLTFYMALPAFAAFVHFLYPQESRRRWLWIFGGLSVAFTLLVIAAPLMLYTRTLIFFHVITLVYIIHFLYAITRASIRGREGARVFLFGGLVLMITVVNDMLYTLRIVDTAYVAPTGLFTFFFSQAFLLSKRFSRAFATVRQLTAELENRVIQRTRELEREKNKSDELLRNILPDQIAQELKEGGAVLPRKYASVSVMFADFVDFTRLSEQMSAESLVRELDLIYSGFDDIVARRGLEKLKTMGDSYMCAGGAPAENATHAVDLCLAALEFQALIDARNQETAGERPAWELRIGIHCGPIAAGVVGKRKFAYDIWGDTVNTAARMESGGAASRINISSAIRDRVSDYFLCEPRGRLEVKGKGAVDMYFLLGLRPEYATDADARRPNETFRRLLAELSTHAA